MAVAQHDDAQPPTLGGLRERHLQLMRGWRGLAESSPAGAADAAGALRKYAAAAGANISDDDGRDEAQGIIDYWTAALSGLKGERSPEFLQLAGYTGAAAEGWARRAQDVFDGYASEEDKRVARALLQMLVVSRGGSYARASAISRASLQQHIGSARLDAVIADFVATGTIGRISAQQPDEDRFEIGDLSLIERWPALKDWLEERKRQADERDAMLKRAEHWSRAGRPDYLLAGSDRDIETLERYRDVTDTLNAYIGASRKRRSREQRWLLAGAVALGAAVTGSIVAFFLFVQPFLDKVRNERAAVKQQIKTAKEEGQNQAVKDLQLTADTNAMQVLTPAPAPIPGTSDTANAIQPGKAAALEGYMWFGQDSQRQVRPDDPKTVLTSFANVQVDTRFRAKTEIYLRKQWPKSAKDYTSPEPKGIVPQDALIVLREKLKAYDRLSGVQYWAHVVYVPQVSLTYTYLRPGRREEIEKVLAQNGFEVASKQDRDAARGEIAVRYYRPAHNYGFYKAGPADALLEVAALALHDGGLADRLRCEATKQPADPDRPQLLELVLDPRAKPSATPAVSCAKAGVQAALVSKSGR